MEDDVILCLNYDGKLTVFCMPNKEQLIAQVERVLDKWKSLGEAT